MGCSSSRSSYEWLHHTQILLQMMGSLSANQSNGQSLSIMPRVLLASRPVLLTKSRHVYPFSVVTSRRRAESSLRASAMFRKQGNWRSRLLFLPSLVVSRKADHCTARMEGQGCTGGGGAGECLSGSNSASWARLLFTPWCWQEAREAAQSVTRKPPSTCFHICKMGAIADTFARVF